MPRKGDISNTDLVYEVVRTAERPLTFAEIFERVNQRRPITTKNPKGTIRGALTGGKQFVHLGNGRYAYLPLLLAGSVLRLPLTEKKPANHPLVYTDEARLAFWPSCFENEKRRDKRPVAAQLPNGAVAQLTDGWLQAGQWGCAMPEPLRAYLVAQRAAAGDSLLVRIVDGEQGVCEIEHEPQRRRDKTAVAARNRELADVVADLLAGRGIADQLHLWDLLPRLLARGAYRAHVPPDDLADVLKRDDRFLASGYSGWLLAAHVTPAQRNEIAMRERLLGALFSPSRDNSDAEFLASAPAREEIQRVFTDLGSLLGVPDAPGAGDPPVVFLDQFRPGALEASAPLAPVDEAQELMFEAWTATSSSTRVRLARAALEIAPDCADAYNLLALETAETPAAAAELYAQGVAAGERALGPEMFTNGVGAFWGIVETRPYMQARLGLAQALWEQGERRAAVEHHWELLRLNPGDNQGVRYQLLLWLLQTDDDLGVQRLVGAYEDDIAATWAYGLALHAFRREGDQAGARRLRSQAVQTNRHVPAYLLGRKALPSELPEYTGFGDDSEAIFCASEQRELWRETPGALDWLAKGLRKRPSS